MLIAIMGDSYARVQANAIAADCRSLAELELEMEQLVSFFFKWFTPHKINNSYSYCFSSTIEDGDEEEDWEGMVG